MSVSNPAQSEVSWTSIATGLNPGTHGLFDFVHRNPADYTLHVSLLPTKKAIFGIQFASPHNAHTIFDQSVENGYPATTLWWPATFPARRESPVHTIPGLGTPDILGRLGVGTYFSLDPNASGEGYKTNVEHLEQLGKHKARGLLKGPLRKMKKGEAIQAAEAFELDWINEKEARLTLGKQEIPLEKGQWSSFLEIPFKMQLGVSVHAITQVLLTENTFGPGLYFLPLQIHPLHASWPYANPNSLGKQLWRDLGPFHTLGWPQDTTGLDEGFMEDSHFLQLCDDILSVRERVLMNQIQSFQEGMLAIVFDSLDRVQHMFWRDRPDILEKWYTQLDSLSGRIEEEIHQHGHQDTRLLIVSDHGFSEFNYKVHLNRWLIESGFLVTHGAENQGTLDHVDWSRTRAYAVGLSSIYLNMKGRESEGVVDEHEGISLANEIKEALLHWEGPDKRKVVRNVWLREEAFHGPLTPYAPDLVVGFNAGYRASGQTGLGGWGTEALEVNTDHWGADHCIDPDLVQGVIFSNVSLEDLPHPSYTDIPELTIGDTLTPKAIPPTQPPTYSDEDREILEERLKDLGYL
ncbi:MAG: hypothetical protein GTO14_17850 [Anaerolineales bacterium]|nr:hypothetical protein [Anaerolineales bacterium]